MMAKRCFDKYPYFQKRISVEEQITRKDTRFLRGSQIAYLICEFTERGFVTQGKCKILTPSGRLENVFSGRLLGLVQEDTLAVFYTRMPRDTVRLSGKKWETQEGLIWSKHSLQYRKWRNRLTWKGHTVERSVLRPELKIPCLWKARWKRSSCDYWHHPVCCGIRCPISTCWWWEVTSARGRENVNRTPSHSAFFSHTFHPCAHAPAWLKVLQRVSHKTHVHPHVIMCLTVRCLSFALISSLPFECLYILSYFFISLYPGHHPPYGRNRRVLKPMGTPQNEECRPVAIHNPLTAYEPNKLDNFDYSDTLVQPIFQDESVDIDTEPTYSCDAELDDERIGKALSSPLNIQERQEPANLRQTYHSHEESLLPAQSFFARSSTGRPVCEPSSDLSQNGNQVTTWKTSKSGFLLETQTEQILAEVRSEIQKHELQAESDKRSIQELTGSIDSQRMEIDHTITGCDQSRRDQLLLQEELSEQNRALRETCTRNMRDIDELQKSHVLKVEELSRRKLTEDQNTIMELRAKIQEL